VIWTLPIICMNFPRSFCYIPLSNNSDTSETAIGPFYQQLQVNVREGKTLEYYLNVFQFAATHLDPFTATGIGKLGLAWINDVVHPGYSEGACYEIAGGVVRLLGKYFFPKPLGGEPSWTPCCLREVLH
jgi:hypothetical protein